MYFLAKITLKNNRYHTLKYILKHVERSLCMHIHTKKKNTIHHYSKNIFFRVIRYFSKTHRSLKDKTVK
jgi:hypothetical protein